MNVGFLIHLHVIAMGRHILFQSLTFTELSNLTRIFLGVDL